MIDWSGMSPRDVWKEIKRLQNEIKLAPKIAGPWRRATGPFLNGHWYEWRDRPLGGTAVYVGPDNSSWDDDGDAEFIGYFESRADADAALRAAGWLLVDEVG